MKDMTQSDPSKRPTSAEVADRFSKIRSTLGGWKLRSRLVHKNEVGSDKILNDIIHFFRTTKYLVFLRPAIPSPIHTI